MRARVRESSTDIETGTQRLKIAIVIVNYRTADYVERCLSSLEQEMRTVPGTCVLVSDNNSLDGSVDRLRGFVENRAYTWVTLLPLVRNGGFSYGNNAAIRHLLSGTPTPDLVWLLNPDTFVSPGALSAVVRFMETHPRAGIVGTRLVDEAGNAMSSARRMITPLTECLGAARLGLLERIFPGRAVAIPPAPVAHECAWVSGASLAMRREVLDDAGLMDEGYFLYFEEIDFCRRVGNCRWQVWYTPDAQVMHIEGVSTGIRGARKRRPAYWYASRRRYLSRQYGILGLVLADLAWATGRLIRVLADIVRPRRDAENDPSWFAYDLLWGDFRALCNGTLMRAVRRGSAES